MNRLFVLPLFFITYFASGLVYAETSKSLVRGGYTLLYEGYAEVEECEPEKPIVVGNYIVRCNSYSYPYHYGNVLLFARSFNYKGRNLLIGYLCLDEDDDDCESLEGIYQR